MRAVSLSATTGAPSLIAAAGQRAHARFLEFFVATIRNPNTRRAYSRAVLEFLAWCEAQGIALMTGIQPLHAGTYIEMQTRDPKTSVLKARP